MPLDAKRNAEGIIGLIQKYLLYVFVVILPVSIMPFPWDYTEKGMTIVILAFTLLIVSLELIKVIWTGKILFLRRDVDFVLFALLISLTITTIFAADTNLSLFGYNYRLSAGFLGISSTFLIAFIARSFLSNKKDLIKLFNALFVGSIIASSISIITLLGGNIFDLVPKLSALGVTGYPIVGAPVVLAIYNCTILFFAYITLNIFGENRKDKDNDSGWLSIVAILVNLVSLIIVTVNATAFYIVILFLSIWMLSLIVIFFKDNKMSSKAKILHLVIPVVILTFSILMQLESVRGLIFGEGQVITPLKLSVDFSWQIVSQSLTRSLRSAVLGLGLDNFGVVFTALRPVELANVSFLTAFNEVLTFLSNGGFLWLVIWLILGWYILKDLIQDFKEYDSRFRTILLFDVLLLFLYLTSFLTVYTALVRLLFLLSISLAVIFRNIYKSDEVNSFLFKIWSMGTGKGSNQDSSATPIFLTVVVTIVLMLGVIKLGGVLLSGLYLLRAESYIIEENAKYVDTGPTIEQETAIVNNLYRWYGNALRYDKGNPLVNRKFSTVATDKLSVLMSEYADSEDEEILNEVVALRREAFEYSRNAINYSPSLYSSYNNRVQIYFQIINLGYTEYIRDTIAVINEALARNPYDYQNYYNKARLYFYLENYDLALEASRQAILAKGDYIEALILSANIYGIKGETEMQLNYLEAIKTILENNDLEETELYNQLIEQIQLITGEGEGTGEEKIEEEKVEEEKVLIDNEDVPEIEQ